MVGRARTLWSATCPAPPTFSASLRGDLDVDVVIVGAGYTGLWTALSLLDADPGTRVAVVERQQVGFGASGRNGGWCSALLPVSLTTLEKHHGRSQAIAWQRAMAETVDIVGEFAARSATAGHDTHFHKGGTVTVARNQAQLRRLESQVAEARRFGFGDTDLRRLGPDEVAALVHAADVRGGLFTPHCAALHPLRLAHAIAVAAERSGAQVIEGVEVVEIGPRRLTTTAGTIHADTIVLATEAYTTQLPGRRRNVLPIYSMMIGSEPLSEAQWRDVGLDDRQTFTVASHLIVYAQRTVDGRFAFGGRGAPYHFASRVDDRFGTDQRVRAALRNVVVSSFPALASVEFPFHWGGPLAAAHDWHPHVAYDPGSGLASAGGYVGDGVAAANLAGRTLADLIAGRRTDLTRLPWVGHRSRRWEPEPLRWLGVNLVATAASRADRAEESTRPIARQRARAWGTLVTMLAGQ